MKKILLIRPNTDALNSMPKSSHALGLLYISSYLKKFGYDVIFRDLNRQRIDDEIKDQLCKGEIAIVGLSMLSFARKEAYELIRLIKTLNENIKIVIGGIYASSLPKLLVDNLKIDATIIGEGELTMKELADYWIKNKGELRQIKGIATKEYGVHEPRELIKNLDDLPFPDYSQIDFSWFKATIAINRPNEVINGIKLGDTTFSNMITSRGCTGRCKFCNAFSHWKYKVRFRSAENILCELKYLHEKQGVNLLVFQDDSFGQNRELAIDICKGMVENNLKIIWFTSMRSDHADEELLGWMKKAGCFSIAYGFESGSSKILRNIGKGITKEHIVRAIRLTKKAGIKAYALLMVGNIGETNETIRETVDLMIEAKPDLYSTAGYVLLCPGTFYYEITKKKGKISDDYWLREENGMPTFYDNFTQEDLNRWNSMINSIGRLW